jgi:hypothetical protein
VFSILAAPDGSVWAGTWGGGVSRFDGTAWRNLTARDGLAGNIVYAIARDAEGNFWFGTDKGVSRYDGRSWKTFGRADGLLESHVYALAIAPDGSVWAGTKRGVVAQLLLNLADGARPFWQHILEDVVHPPRNGGQSWAVALRCSAFVFETFYALHLHAANEGFGTGRAPGRRVAVFFEHEFDRVGVRLSGTRRMRGSRPGGARTGATSSRRCVTTLPETAQVHRRAVAEVERPARRRKCAQQEQHRALGGPGEAPENRPQVITGEKPARLDGRMVAVAAT